MKYRFGDFSLDLRRGTLEGAAGVVHLRPQAFKLLEVLVTRAPEIIGHEELLDLVWGTRHLSPSSLKQTISEVRHALGDAHDVPHFIETVHRRGYRFIGAVDALGDPRQEKEAAPPAPSAAAAPPAAVPAATADTERKAPEVVEPPAALPEGAFEAVTRGSAPPRPIRFYPWLVLVLVCGLGVWGIFQWREDPPSPAKPGREGITPVAGPRLVAAVLGFAIRPGSDLAAWVPIAIGELLAVELASGSGVQLVGGDEVARLHRELLVDGETPLDARALERVRTYLGCDLVLRGELEVVGPELRLRLQAIDTHSEKVLFDDRLGGRQADLAALARQVATRLHEKVALPRLQEEDAGGPRWSGPDREEALRLYALGIEKLRAGEAVAARDFLLEAAAGDPANALVFRALARAHQELGYVVLAQEAAQRAFELSTGLPREVRLGIEGQLYLTRREFAEAAEVFGALHRFFPDDLDHGLQLAAALTKNRQLSEAAEVLEHLRQLSPPRGDHPLIDLQMVQTFEGSDPPRALEAARTGARKAAKLGASLLVARGRRDEGWMLYRLSRFDEALVALGEAEAIYRASGDLAKVVSVLGTRATVLTARSDRKAEAKATFEEAVRISREIGNPGTESQILNNFASFTGTDDIPLTRALLRRSLEIKQQVGDQAGEALTRLNLANLYRFEGRLAEARELIGGALDLYRQLGDKFRIAFALRTLGSLLAKEGQAAEAARAFVEACQNSREAGDARGEANALFEHGQLLLQQGDREGALEKVRQSRDIFARLDLIDDLVFSDLQIGDILWQRGERDAARKVYLGAGEMRGRIGSERVRSLVDQRLASGPPPDP